MRILFLLQDVPFPIVDGMRWKMFYLLDFMSKKHECDVMAYASKYDIECLQRELPNVNWIAIFPQNKGLSLLGKAFLNFLNGKPLSFARYQRTELNQKLSATLAIKKYDVIHYDIINMAQFHQPAIPSIHSPNDSASLSYMLMSKGSNNIFVRLRMLFSAAMFLRYEKKYYPKFNKIHVVSENDKKYLNKTVPLADVISIPFGVPAVRLDRSRNVLVSDDEFSILVLGSACSPGTAKGIELFIKSVIPKLLTEVPNVRVRVQGKGVVSLVHGIDSNIKNLIEASDWIDDLDDLIKRSSIVVLPDLFGTGVKTRTLESMACGAVVVGSDAAFDGIGHIVENGVDCIIVNNHAEFFSVIRDLINDKQKRAKISSAANMVVEKYLSWDVLGPIYEKLYQDVAKSK